MTTSIALIAVLFCNILSQFSVDAFTLNPAVTSSISRSLPSRRQRTTLQYAVSDDDDEDDEEDDDDDDDDPDDFIDPKSLGDWRNFRRNLSIDESSDSENKVKKAVSKENEKLLLSQNKQLGEEYKTGVWAHPTATVSSLVCWETTVPVSFALC
jgi:hypothetical protein